MSHPYDRLFHVANSILGGKCKHLISSGFSFGDSHIDDTPITPKIASGAISFANFCELEPMDSTDLAIGLTSCMFAEIRKLWVGMSLLKPATLGNLVSLLNFFRG